MMQVEFESRAGTMEQVGRDGRAPTSMAWILGASRRVEGIEVFWPAEGLLATLIGGRRDTRTLVVEGPAGQYAEIEVLDAPGDELDGALIRGAPPSATLEETIARAQEHMEWKTPLPGHETARTLLRSSEQERAWRLCRLEYFELCRKHRGLPPVEAMQAHRARWPRSAIGSAPPARGSLPDLGKGLE